VKKRTQRHKQNMQREEWFVHMAIAFTALKLRFVRYIHSELSFDVLCLSTVYPQDFMTSKRAN
jgi:hypothetical protein